MNFEGKVVLVTGASSGIGEATALKFAEEGAKVVVADLREEKGQEVVQKINGAGGEGIFIKTDVTKRADIEALVAGTVAKFGKLDCAVNNAGIAGATLTPLADITEEDWDLVMNVNLRAVWMCMKYEIPEMLKQGKGAIVNLSSIYGFKPSEIGHAAYCTSKFGVIGMSQTAAVDYGQQGLRINAVSPAYTSSEMVDPYVVEAPELIDAVVRRHSAANRLGQPAEIAEAITWLCSDAASFVNGVALPVDGGPTSKLY
jgi:NAD(P)-dependent dehydrogenase (short-subunit alcohol dehydrogenase family)